MNTFQTMPENRTTNSLSIDCHFLNHGKLTKNGAHRGNWPFITRCRGKIRIVSFIYLFIYLFILFIYEWMSGCLLDMHKIESRYGFDKDVSMSIALLYCVSGCDWDTSIKFVSLFWLPLFLFNFLLSPTSPFFFYILDFFIVILNFELWERIWIFYFHIVYPKIFVKQQVFACLIFIPIKIIVVVTWNLHMIKVFLNTKQERLEINSPINFFIKKFI